MNMTLTQTIFGIFTTNGISFEIGAVLLLAFCAGIMSIQDWRIGMISLFLGSAVEYILFFVMGLDRTMITYLLFISIILMAFAIFSVRQGGQLIG